MSWQLISVVVLLVAIGAGMLWYERSRPPSQIVALVAVLAALAVAGRIALAPIPNVIATTDIVIIAGFVLGPAPGFAVGALGGLVSNFWLGQGVWTPWQMVAWGMSGVAGGMLWKLTRGRMNRWWLAAFCGAAGLAFGAWMNLQTMVSFGGEMSLDRYLALEVRAIPFDIAHMTGNIAFALIAGPAMIAALTRFRNRFEWRIAGNRATTGGPGANGSGEAPIPGAQVPGDQIPGDRRPGGTRRTAAGVTMIVLAALLFTFGASPTPRAEAAYTARAIEAATWLKSQQNQDGGFASTPGGTSSITMTSRAMFALAATGINPLDVKTKATPYGYLVNNRKQIMEANDIALAILAMKTVGQDPRDLKGWNLIKALRNRRGNGSFRNDVNVASFAVLAFRSAGASKDAQYSMKWLNQAQNKNGGWGIAKGASSGVDSTATVLTAITWDKAVNRGIRFLDGKQKDSGGFVSGSTVNSQSTGLVIQGLIAQGYGMNHLKRNGNSSADYLLARQQDDGSIWYSRASDQTRVWVTADVTAALAGKALPIAAPKRKQDVPDDSGSNGGATPDSGDDGGENSNTPTYTPPPASLTDPDDSGSSSNHGNDFGNFGNPSPGNSGNPDGQDTGTDPVTPAPTDTTIPLVPEAPSDAVLAASEAGPRPSPIIAILIALAVGGGLCGGTILLARRFRW